MLLRLTVGEEAEMIKCEVEVTNVEDGVGPGCDGEMILRRQATCMGHYLHCFRQRGESVAKHNERHEGFCACRR